MFFNIYKRKTRKENKFFNLECSWYGIIYIYIRINPYFEKLICWTILWMIIIQLCIDFLYIFFYYFLLSIILFSDELYTFIRLILYEKKFLQYSLKNYKFLDFFMYNFIYEKYLDLKNSWKYNLFSFCPKFESFLYNIIKKCKKICIWQWN